MDKICKIRWNKEDFSEVNMTTKKLRDIEGGVETTYDIGGGSGRKLLNTIPDPTAQMSTDAMFNVSELEGYTFIEFIVTNTAGAYEVKELCGIAPLKAHSGQFVISYPISNELWVRKIYRSSGAVKPSIGVYEIGKTTEDRNQCIIKEAYAVK